MTAICCPQWGVPSGPWGKDQGDAVRASRASTGAREVGGGGVTHSNYLVAHGCVSVECIVESI